MIDRPKLKSFLTVFPLSDNTWGLRGGTDELWRIKLRSKQAMQIFGSLLPYLDGRLTTDEILAELEEQSISRDAALQILRHLESSSLVEEVDTAGLAQDETERYRDQITFFSRFSTAGGSSFQVALRHSHVGLVGSGKLSHALLHQLDAAGIGKITHLVSSAPADDQHPGGEPSTAVSITTHELDREAIWAADAALPRLLIVPQESHDPEFLEAVDRWSKQHQLPWLLVRAVDFQEGWVGPLFIPGETASYLSLDARLKGNIPFYAEHQVFDARVRQAGEPAAPLGGLHSFFYLLSSIAVTEVIKFLSEIRVPHLAGRFLTINLWTWDIETHEVLRVPSLDRSEPETRPTVFPWQEKYDADDAHKLS